MDKFDSEQNGAASLGIPPEISPLRQPGDLLPLFSLQPTEFSEENQRFREELKTVIDSRNARRPDRRRHENNHCLCRQRQRCGSWKFLMMRSLTPGRKRLSRQKPNRPDLKNLLPQSQNPLQRPNPSASRSLLQSQNQFPKVEVTRPPEPEAIIESQANETAPTQPSPHRRPPVSRTYRHGFTRAFPSKLKSRCRWQSSRTQSRSPSASP